MQFCPMCGKPIVGENKQHLRSVAELKTGVLICNNQPCINKSGGWDVVKAYSGKTTNE